MLTATVSSEVNEQITELLGEATALQDEARAKNSEAQERFAKIRDLADKNSGDYEVGSNGAAPKAATPKKTVTGGGATTTTGGAKKKVAKKVAKKKKGPVSASERNYDNRKTLGLAIFDIVNREEWPALELEEEIEGPTAGEIKKILAIEGDWSSSSADPGNQVSAAIGKLRDADKIKRVDGRRYCVVKGATYD